MRILFLNWKDLSQPDAGGAERYVRHVAEIWAARGHDVSVIVPRVGGLTEFEDLRGVQYIRLGSRHTVFHLARRHLKGSARTWDHVIESVSTRPFCAHRVVGTDASTALYHQTAREVWHAEFPFPIDRLGRHILEPWWIRQMRGARIVAVSPSTASELRVAGLTVLTIAPPGCDSSSQCGERLTPPDPPSLVFLGRLVAAKRPQDAIEAFQLIKQRVPGAELHVIGDGYLRKSLESGGDSAVVFHGFVSESEKRSLLRQSSVLLLPGTREGWGIVAMEAAAEGLPVAAYNIPGVCDAVEDGRTGVLTGQTPASLARGTLSLLENQTTWRAMSLAARQRSLTYTWEVCADKLMQAVSPTTPG
jgi:glycosyltransferase involved in cell wall biosynthesis